MIIELAKKKSFETTRATKEKAMSILETTKDKIHEILNFQNMFISCCTHRWKWQSKSEGSLFVESKYDQNEIQTLDSFLINLSIVNENQFAHVRRWREVEQGIVLMFKIS